MTAIEWYQKAIFEILKHKENLSDEMFLQNMLNVHLRAKEMEEAQRKNDFRSGWNGNKHKDWNCEFYLIKHINNDFKTK